MIAICICAPGPHLGAQKLGTPIRCEACGFMTAEQMAALTSSAIEAFRDRAIAAIGALALDEDHAAYCAGISDSAHVVYALGANDGGVA